MVVDYFHSKNVNSSVFLMVKIRRGRIYFAFEFPTSLSQTLALRRHCWNEHHQRQVRSGLSASVHLVESLVMVTCWDYNSSCFAGACWPSLRRPPSAQLLLGGRGLHLQVLRGDPHRPLPQGRQTQPRHPVDHKGGAQAPGDARPDLGRQEEPRPGQGPQVPPDHRRLPPRRLEEAQHPAAAPLSLEGARDLYIHKINILFMVKNSTPSFFQWNKSFRTSR